MATDSPVKNDRNHCPSDLRLLHAWLECDNRHDLVSLVWLFHTNQRFPHRSPKDWSILGLKESPWHRYSGNHCRIWLHHLKRVFIETALFLHNAAFIGQLFTHRNVHSHANFKCKSPGASAYKNMRNHENSFTLPVCSWYLQLLNQINQPGAMPSCSIAFHETRCPRQMKGDQRIPHPETNHLLRIIAWLNDDLRKSGHSRIIPHMNQGSSGNEVWDHQNLFKDRTFVIKQIRFLPKLQMDDTLQSASLSCGKKTLLEATMGKVLDQCRKLAWVCFSHLSLKSPNVIADEACPLLQPPPTSLLELAMVFVQQPAIFKSAQAILKKWHRQIFWSLDLFAELLENSTNQRTASKESKNKFEHRLRKTFWGAQLWKNVKDLAVS